MTDQCPSSDAAPPHRAMPGVGPWEVLAFGCELAMLAALGVAGWQGADALPGRIGLMLALPGIAIAIWAVWMAPTSPRRLANPGRLVAQVVLFALSGAALAVVGHPWWGAAVAVISIVDVAVLARREPRPAGRP